MDGPDDPNYQLFLENYPLLCPNLTSIKFDFFQVQGVQDHKTVSRTLTKAICDNSDWRHVNLSPPVDHVVLKHLCMYSTVNTVSLTLAPLTSRPDETCFGPEDTHFRNVRDLALVLWNSLDFATCLLRPREQMFHSFKVTLQAASVATKVSALLTALASPQRAHSLRSIDISHIYYLYAWARRPTASDKHREPLSYETFRPLVPFVHLRELVINLNHPTLLNDEEFASLTRNWPLLEIVRMWWAPGGDPVTSITLRGLLLLLTSCRKLREIGLTWDAQDVPVGAYEDACSPSITNPIHLHNSSLQHPDLVAEVFKKHLPSVPGVIPSFTWYLPDHTANNVDFSFNPLECQKLWWQVNNHIGHPLFV